jgi:hypothetical protein
MANRAKQPKFSGIPGDYQTFCEDFELFWESLGGTTGTDDRQKLHVFKNCLDETNAKVCASRMLSGSSEFSYQIFKNEMDQKYSLRMTDREARKNWESVNLKYEGRLSVNTWETFCVKFEEARRHVKNLAPWEGRELLLAQLPHEVRCKLLTEEEKKSKLRIRVTGLETLDNSRIFEFFKRAIGVNLQTVKTTPQGTEVQVYDISDLTRLLSHDNKALTTGESLKLTAVRFQMSEKEIMEWVTNYVRVDEVSRAYVKPGQEWKNNPRPHRPAVAWNIDQKAREV